MHRIQTSLIRGFRQMSLVRGQYKKRILPFISTNIIPPTAEEAVNNILYNAPTEFKTPSQKHILNCLVSNEPGVLSRISGILAGRGFNIDSLVVAKTDVKDLSRMTIVINGEDNNIDKAIKVLDDIVPVWAVLDYSETTIVQREVLLVKVSTVPQELNDIGEENIQSKTLISPLMTFSLHRQSINELAKLFEAKVVDVGHDTMILELCAKSTRIDAFIELLRPFGILESARSGTMAMPRSAVSGLVQEEAETEDQEQVDATMLPPG